MALSQGVTLFSMDGDSVVCLPLAGVPNGALMLAELREHGFIPVPEEDEPWDYADDGVWVVCDSTN